MSSIPGGEKRSVVPRWRTSPSFASSPEAQAIGGGQRRFEMIQGIFERSYSEWEIARTAGHLADLFSIAIVEGRTQELPRLASLVLNFGDQVPRVLQKIAERHANRTILEFSAERNNVVLDVDGELAAAARYVTKLRKRVAAYPRDGFAWHDLSYMYNLLGEELKSERAMIAALKVSDSHRLIARSASRLFVHRSENERAMRVLKRSHGFKGDPWLVSAHLAIAQINNEPSSALNAAKKLYDDLASGDKSSSELGMAIATQELYFGKPKKAKQVARESIRNPTENALAQGVWLAPRLNFDLNAEDVVASTDRAFEARSWDFYYRGDWKNSLVEAVSWLQDEPFSTVPALHGSFVAATLLGEFELSSVICKFGLKHNPNSWSLRNNLVVALASMKEIDAAMLEFSSLREPEENSDNYPVWLATYGLLRYGEGDIESARKFYGDSRKILEKNKNRSGQMVSAIYQSIQEATVGNFDVAESLVGEVQRKLGFQVEKSKNLIDCFVEEVLSENKTRLQIAKEP